MYYALWTLIINLYYSMNQSETILLNDVASISSPNNAEEEKISEQKDLFRTKRSYVPVEVEKRKSLIRLVLEEGVTIK